MDKWKFKNTTISLIAVAFFFIIGVFNTSQFGASLSWMLIPFMLVIVGRFLGNQPIQIHTMHLLALSFWFVCFLSTILSSLVSLERDIITSLLFTIMFILITSDHSVVSHANFFVKLYIIIVLIASLMVIINWTRGIYYNEWFERSTIVIGGVAKDPNYVSGFLAPGPILILLYNKYNKKQKHNLIQWFLIGFVLLSMILNGSRGGLVSAILPIIGSVLFSAEGTGKKVKAFIIGCVIFIVLLLVIYNFFPQQTIDRLLHSTGNVRSDLWAAAIKPFLNSPILGEGIGAASVYSWAIEGNASHNMYIDILSSTGLIGSIIYIALLWNCGFNIHKKNLDIYLSAFACLIPQFFINGFNTTSQWIPIIMIYFTSMMMKEHLQEKEQLE